jgi:hypothetical protein
LTEPERIDFKKVIADIEAAGITPYKLSVMMHRKWDKVKRWKAGTSEPAYYEGCMLLEIYRSLLLKKESV